MLWDCIPLLDEQGRRTIDELGGLRAICLSHPHFYAAHLEFAEAFDAPVFLPRADERWIPRRSPRIELFDDEVEPVPGVTVARTGGHFDGACVLHWPDGSGGRGALLTGDTIMVVEDRGWVSFMWSFPNLIPLDPDTVDDVARRVGRFRFDRVYGGVVGARRAGRRSGGGAALGRALRRPGTGRAALTIGDAGCPIGNSTVSVRSSCADLRREQNRRMTPDHVVARADRPVRSPRQPPRAVPTPQPLAPGVSALLDLQRAAGNGATAGLLVPVQRQKKKAVGVAKYGTTRLTTRLQDMMQRGVLGVAGAPATLDREQLFMLQGVANVETGGMDNAVYTRDNMYVSLGFKQVTLGWGSLYEIIEAAPAAFAKHGIVLGGGTYTLKAGVKPAIEGAADPVALKTPPWTDRFFDAGAEDEVVSAIVAYTLKELGRMERRFAKDSPGRSTPWMKDPTARAWLLETMNNRPAYAYTAAKGTLRRTSGQELTRDAFLAVLESEILGAYEARGERVKGEHIIAKIPRVVPSGGPAAAPGPSASGGSATAPVTGSTTPATTPATGAKGTELVGDAATVLPPGKAATTGSGVVAAIGAAGLVPAALRMLVAAGHGDANALTNLAFWAAHPELFGTKLQPSQPGFAQLSAEWIRLRDGIVRAAHSARRRRSRRHRRRHLPLSPRREPSPRTWSPPRARRRGSPVRRRPGAATSTSRRAPATTATSPTRARRRARSASGSTGRPARTSAT